MKTGNYATGDACDAATTTQSVSQVDQQLISVHEQVRYLSEDIDTLERALSRVLDSPSPECDSEKSGEIKLVPIADELRSAVKGISNSRGRIRDIVSRLGV